MSSYREANLSYTVDPPQQDLKTPQGSFPSLPGGFPVFPGGLPPSPESFAGLSMPMLPPNLLLAMQSNLPPEKVREMLNEQADMLESMVSKMKVSQEDEKKVKPRPVDENESVRGSNSRRTAEFEARRYENERDLREFKDIKDPRDLREIKDSRESREFRDVREAKDYKEYRDPRDIRETRDNRDFRDFRDQRDNFNDKRQFERKEEFYSQRDSDMLKQELASVKLREESTYLELQKAHHQIHMLESQLLELQRKHFTELEHLNFENIESKRKLEAAEFKNASLMKENDYLKAQIAAIKRQQESFDREREGSGGDGFKRDYREGREYREQFDARESREVRKVKDVKEQGFKKDNWERRDSPDESYRREPGKRINSIESRNYDKSPDDSYNRRKPVVKVEPIVDLEPKKKEYMPVRTIVNTSSNVTEALTWNTHKRNDRTAQPNDNLQQKLNDLISDQNRLKSEIERVSEIRGQNASKRKSDLELELSICESNINSLTAKLRKMNWLSNS